MEYDKKYQKQQYSTPYLSDHWVSFLSLVRNIVNHSLCLERVLSRPTFRSLVTALTGVNISIFCFCLLSSLKLFKVSVYLVSKDYSIGDVITPGLFKNSQIIILGRSKHKRVGKGDFTLVLPILCTD